ncbi:MAG: VanZ family protein [Pseudomonadota bacterium]
MTQPTALSIWLSRALITVFAIIFGWLALQPDHYNFAHFIPHDTLDWLGIDYQYQLSFEQNADIVLHFLAGFLMLSLLCFALPTTTQTQVNLLFGLICVACVSLELWQSFTPRGFSTKDMLIGISGAFVAYSALSRCKFN